MNQIAVVKHNKEQGAVIVVPGKIKNVTGFVFPDEVVTVHNDQLLGIKWPWEPSWKTGYTVNAVERSISSLTFHMPYQDNKSLIVDIHERMTL